MARWTAFAATAATALISTLGLAGDTLAANRVTTAEARSVAVEFFRSQNERRYDDTCALLARGFYKSHALRDRRTCSAVIRVVFVWNGKIDFRIGTATREGSHVVVQAVADGAPGRIVLVREQGRSGYAGIVQGEDALGRVPDPSAAVEPAQAEVTA